MRTTRTGRRPAPSGRRLLSALASLSLLATLLLVAPGSAHATTTMTGVVALPGKDRVTVTWDPVANAQSYRVEVARNAAMTKSHKSTRTGSTTAVVKKLKRSTTYYVRVSAQLQDGTTAAVSELRKVLTTTKSTGRGQILSVSGAGTNKIRVVWSGYPRGTSIDVRVGIDNEPIWDNKSSGYFQVKGLPITDTSATISIPASFQPLIGSSTANPAYVQLIAHNAGKHSRSKIVYGWPSPLASTAQIRLATYNVSGASHTTDLSGHTWADRRQPIANNVFKAAPDVLAVQEATTAFVSGNSGVRNYEDLANVLAPTYRLAYDAYEVGTAGTTTTKGDHLFYNPATIRVLKSGLHSGKLPGTDWKGVDRDRYFAWGLFEQISTGQRFFMVSVHLERGKSFQNLRNQMVLGLNSFLADMNPSGYPMVIAGDFNSMMTEYRNGPSTTLVKAGYVDTAAAPIRTGATLSTTNAGYPTKPKSYTYVGTRIDYIMVKNGLGSSKAVNQVVLTSTGAFDKNYYGSDHNLQWADVRIG